jgi:RimJ/RimL family protein N-acetyltransferase
MSASGLAIQLRPVRPGDLDVLRTLRRDFDTQKWLLGHPPPEDDTLAWIERREGAARGYFAIVCEDAGGRALGYVQLTDIHGIDRHAFGGIAIAASERGRGLGRLAMRELMRFAGADLGLRKLMLLVRYDNAAALGLYRSLGFREVGVLRDHYRHLDTLHDVMLMEIFLSSETPR